MLVTRRLVLRAVETEDLRSLWRFHNELSLAGHPPLPQSYARLENHYKNKLSDSNRDNAWFVVTLSDEVIGECSLTGLRITGNRLTSCELGIQLYQPEIRGMGLGTEAVTSLLNYAFLYWDVNRIQIRILSDNEAAAKCFGRCGFVWEGRLRQSMWADGRYRDEVLMSILRRDWNGTAKDSRGPSPNQRVEELT